jgi:hypothetical protein
MEVTAERADTTYTVTLSTEEMLFIVGVIGETTQGGNPHSYIYSELARALRENGEMNTVTAGQLFRAAKLR